MKMRKTMFLAMGLTLFFSSVLGALADEKGGQWKMVLQSEAKHSAYIGGFHNEQDGITIGYAGEVHYTHDGGKTWPTAVNHSWCRFGLEILDKNTAWHCGNKGHVRVSTDGGEIWEPVADFGDMEPDQCRFLSFADANLGWIASPFRIAATNNGAKSWNEFDLPEDSKNIAAICLRTANDGYVLDVTGNLYVTKDAGKTWSKQGVPLEGKPLPTLQCPTAAMRFSDANHGIIVAATKGKIYSYTTADGGKTWTKSLVSDKHFGYLFLNHEGNLLTVTGKLGNLTSREGVLITVFRLQ
jgi:photosystem II stability/assembly factor-like uncharacterized protein